MSISSESDLSFIKEIYQELEQNSDIEKFEMLEGSDTSQYYHIFYFGESQIKRVFADRDKKECEKKLIGNKMPHKETTVSEEDKDKLFNRRAYRTDNLRIKLFIEICNFVVDLINSLIKKYSTDGQKIILFRKQEHKEKLLGKKKIVETLDCKVKDYLVQNDAVDECEVKAKKLIFKEGISNKEDNNILYKRYNPNLVISELEKNNNLKDFLNINIKEVIMNYFIKYSRKDFLEKYELSNKIKIHFFPEFMDKMKVLANKKGFGNEYLFRIKEIFKTDFIKDDKFNFDSVSRGDGDKTFFIVLKKK